MRYETDVNGIQCSHLAMHRQQCLFHSTPRGGFPVRAAREPSRLLAPPALLAEEHHYHYVSHGSVQYFEYHRHSDFQFARQDGEVTVEVAIALVGSIDSERRSSFPEKQFVHKVVQNCRLIPKMMHLSSLARADSTSPLQEGEQVEAERLD